MVLSGMLGRFEVGHHFAQADPHFFMCILLPGPYQEEFFLYNPYKFLLGGSYPCNKNCRFVGDFLLHFVA